MSLEQYPAMLSPNSDSGSSLTEKRIKNPSWTEREHDVAYQSLRELRGWETIHDAIPMRDTRLWATISERLKHYGIIRTPHSCKAYWSRYGREATKFDERAEPKPDMLSTCVQRTKANLTQTTRNNSPHMGSKFQPRPDASPLGNPYTEARVDHNQGLSIFNIPQPHLPLRLPHLFEDNITMAPQQQTPASSRKPPRAKRNITLNPSQNTEKNSTPVIKKRTRATKEALALQQPTSSNSTPNPPAPAKALAELTVAKLRARAARVEWTPEQLAHLGAESVKSQGNIPHEEQYSWLNQKLGPRVKYQDIKDWFVVNAAALASRNSPNVETEDEDDYDLDNVGYKTKTAPHQGGLLASVPFYPVDPKTIIPEKVVRYFQTLNQNEGLDGHEEMSIDDTFTNQSFNGDEEPEIIADNAAKRRCLTQEESMNCFRERYPLSPLGISLPVKTPFDMASAAHPQEVSESRTPTIQKEMAISTKDSRKRSQGEPGQPLSVAQRYRSSRAYATVLTQSRPATQDPAAAALERRIKFEEVNLAEIERLMKDTAFEGAWYQHLSEKAEHSRGKLQGFQSVLSGHYV